MAVKPQPRICGFHWQGFDSGRPLHAVLLFAGFFSCMFLHDLVQEAVQSRMRGKVSFGLLMSGVECFACTVGPLLSDNPFRSRRGPLRLYIALSAIVGVSISLSNLSLGYVAYPIKVVGKSTKLVPAMAMSWCILSKKYGLKDYLCALLLCLGLAGFTLAENEVTGEQVSLFGVALLLGACTADALSPNLQEKLLKWRGGKDARGMELPPPTAIEVMAFTNLFSGAGIGTAMAFSGELSGSVEFLSNDYETLLLLCTMGTLTFAGITFYMTCVQQYSGVTVVLVATIRKCFTVVCSFLIFAHKANMHHILSGGVMIAGIALRTFWRNKKVGGAKDKDDGTGGTTELPELSNAETVAQNESDPLVDSNDSTV